MPFCLDQTAEVKKGAHGGWGKLYRSSVTVREHVSLSLHPYPVPRVFTTFYYNIVHPPEGKRHHQTENFDVV